MAFIICAFLLFFNYFCILEAKNQVLVVAFDRFGHDIYLKDAHFPAFDRIAENGISTRYGMKPVFPTKSLPNLFSIVTGLYPQHHGIVEDEMYDPVSQEFFKKTSTNPKWWNAEPIWIKTTRNGKKSGIYFWPGSEVVIDGILPDRNMKYDSSVLFKDRLNTVMSWLTDEKVDLAMLHYPEPDKTSHSQGTHGWNVNILTRQVNSMVEKVLDQIEAHNLTETLDLIVLSDHGMMNLNNITSESFQDLSKVVNSYYDVSAFVDGQTMVGYFPKDEVMAGNVYRNLQSVVNEKFIALKKKDLPEHFYYKDNTRIPPIIALAKPGYGVFQSSTPYGIKGLHGYDNELPEMQAIFFARGPSFKKNFVADQFSVLDVYPLLCKLLQLEPSNHNGSLANVENILSNSANLAKISIFLVFPVLLNLVNRLR